MTIGDLGTMAAGRESRLLALLVSVVTMLLLSPLVEGGKAEQEVILVLTGLVLIAAVHAASDRRRDWVIAAGLAVPWTALAWGGLIVDSVTLATIADALFAALCAFTMIIALRHIATARTITFDVLCGAAAVYLLIGLTWAVSYGLLETLSPGALALPNPNVQAAWTQVLYFSFATLTTLGYGDILPVSSFARIWSTMEAVAGTFYMALLVARLVSLYRG